MINSKKISHAYMFVGQDKNKLLAAKEFAKSILCVKELLNNPDFMVVDVEPDEKSIKIEQIRNMIQKVYEKPIVSKKKVYIINNAEKMTKEAGNCLLKTLEEPPEYVTIIIIVLLESMLLNTIRSRCQKIVFREEADEKNSNQSTELIQILNNIFKKDMSLLDFLEECRVIYDKENIHNILEYMNVIFMEKLKNNMDNVNTNKYIECIKLIEKTKNKLKYNANFDMSIDNMLFKLYKLER